MNNELKSLVCPACGIESRIAQVDTIPGYAMIAGVNSDGTIEWSGQTKIEWNMQRPAESPPEFICLACSGLFSQHELGIKLDEEAQI